MCQVILADLFVHKPADELLVWYACAAEQASRLLMAAFCCIHLSLIMA